jgi:hypothetical protein
MSTHVRVSELPDSLRSALVDARYCRGDVAVEVRESVTLMDAGGAGRRGFAVFVNLETGEARRVNGSWGGANAFNPQNRVDLDDTPHPLVEGLAVIQGSEGGDGVSASIVVCPANAARLLPEKAETSEREQLILYAHSALKGGTYRQEFLTRHGVVRAELDAMVKRGLLKYDGLRRIQITTAGKNARDPKQYFS